MDAPGAAECSLQIDLRVPEGQYGSIDYTMPCQLVRRHLNR
jgi:hypothetical protein